RAAHGDPDACRQVPQSAGGSDRSPVLGPLIKPSITNILIRSATMKVGFIGLGIMGTPMAGHLIKAGHEVFLFSIPSIPPSLVEAGGKACASGKEVAQKTDVIITMVPDTPHVAAALFDPNGVAEGLSRGKTVVDMSSISPVETKKFAER